MSGFLQRTGDVGMQGLGAGAGLIDLIQAGRQGQLGQTLLQRQLALQNPAVRESVGPFLAGFLGTFGKRGPTEELGRAGLSRPLPGGVEVLGPGQAPGTAQTGFQANLPSLSPSVQIEQLFKQAQLGNVLGDIQLIPLRAQLLQAQAGQAEGEAGWLQQLQSLSPSLSPRSGARTLGGGNVGGDTDLELTGFSRTGPIYGRKRARKIQAATEGTIDPLTGEPLTEPRQIDNTILTPIRKPLSGSDLGAVSALNTMQSTIDHLKNEFSPEERQRYSGMLNFYLGRGLLTASQLPLINQLVPAADPRFAQFSAVVGNLRSFVFGDGGKQLTPFEASVTQSYVPWGTETGGPAEFEAKLGEFEKRIERLQTDREAARSRQPTGRTLQPRGTASGVISAQDFLGQ